MPYELTDEQRNRYRATSIRAQLRKQELLREHSAATPAPGIALGERLDPNDLMPLQEPNGLTSLSLFAGGGGLDLGFERAGFGHCASFEILDICGSTLRANRSGWDIRSGDAAGDVRAAAFTPFRGVDVVHGDPPVPALFDGRQAGGRR